MITIKAFNKGLVCKDFQYEIGKTYKIPKEDVIICEHGFHASANCDISETVDYYPVSTNTEYALVDINVVDKKNDKVVGDKIKIIKKLDSVEELIEYDKTGKWCVSYASINKNIDIKRFENLVIQKDTTGEWCYRFACWVKGANIKRLENAVIEKDQTGEWCYRFACWVKGANIKRLENAVIEKDQTGEWCEKFAEWVEGADVKKLRNKVDRKYKDSWYKKFTQWIKDISIFKFLKQEVKK